MFSVFMQKLNYRCSTFILCLELLSVQIVSFHYMFSLLHIPKMMMMMNATMTFQPTTKYSTCLLSLLFSTPLLLLFFSTIPLPPLAFVCVHSSTLPFPLLFFVVFQWHFLHSCYCELQNFKNVHNF